jgi:hypothetical protein
MTRMRLNRAGLILGLIASPACLSVALAGPYTGTGGGARDDGERALSVLRGPDGAPGTRGRTAA